MDKIISTEFSAELRLRVIHELLRLSLKQPPSDVLSPSPPVKLTFPAPVSDEEFWKHVSNGNEGKEKGVTKSERQQLLASNAFSASSKEITALSMTRPGDVALGDDDFDDAFDRLIDAVDENICPMSGSARNWWIKNLLGGTSKEDGQSRTEKLYQLIQGNLGPSILISRGQVSSPAYSDYVSSLLLCIWCCSHRYTAAPTLAKRISVWRFLAVAHCLISDTSATLSSPSSLDLSSLGEPSARLLPPPMIRIVIEDISHSSGNGHPHPRIEFVHAHWAEGSEAAKPLVNDTKKIGDILNAEPTISQKLEEKATTLASREDLKSDGVTEGTVNVAAPFMENKGETQEDLIPVLPTPEDQLTKLKSEQDKSEGVAEAIADLVALSDSFSESHKIASSSLPKQNSESFGQDHSARNMPQFSEPQIKQPTEFQTWVTEHVRQVRLGRCLGSEFLEEVGLKSWGMLSVRISLQLDRLNKDDLISLCDLFAVTNKVCGDRAISRAKLLRMGKPELLRSVSADVKDHLNKQRLD